MKYRKLGSTDIEVSVVCQGCWSIVGDATWGPQDEADSVAAIDAALDAGINFFDTAVMYGDGYSEELLGRTLAARRDEVVIASKYDASHTRLADIKADCEAALKRLRTDTIDLYQVHWPSPGMDMPAVIGALAELRAEGKIRAIGVSNFGPAYLADALAAGPIAANQLSYSLLWRPIEHEILPTCVAEGVGILCYSPLCQALLTGKFASADQVPPGRARMRLFSKDRPQSRHDEPGCEAELFDAIARVRRISDGLGRPMGNVALAWLLARPGVTSVLAGGRNAAQTAENAKAADIELPADVIEQLSAATEAVKAYAGTNADMWQTVSRLDAPGE